MGGDTAYKLVSGASSFSSNDRADLIIFGKANTSILASDAGFRHYGSTALPTPDTGPSLIAFRSSLCQISFHIKRPSSLNYSSEHLTHRGRNRRAQQIAGLAFVHDVVRANLWHTFGYILRDKLAKIKNVFNSARPVCLRFSCPYYTVQSHLSSLPIG